MVYGSETSDAVLVPYTYENTRAAAADNEFYAEHGFYEQLVEFLSADAKADTMFELRQDLANGSGIDYFWSAGVPSCGLMTDASSITTVNQAFFEFLVRSAS
jgi:hypothetical protein